MKNELKKLIGKKVICIEEYDDGIYDKGFFITFDNNMILTAQDGEFGDNAFSIVSETNYKHSNKKNILLDGSFD